MTINHPGMTPQWFDTAVHRAMCAGLEVYEAIQPGRTVWVPSQRQPGAFHAVTRTSCTCEGHQHAGRCLHRALAIAWFDAFREKPLPNPVRAREEAAAIAA